MAGAPRDSPPQTASPLLAVLRGACQLFVKMCSKPHAAAALPFVLQSPRRVSSLSCSLRSPIPDAVKTLGEKPPLFSMFIFRCV
jgi:hypothetical protein